MRDIVFVMPGQSPYVAFLVEQFEPLGEITARAMFGGHCLYCDGTVFAIVAGSSLYLKTDEENRGEFVNRGLAPFKPFENRDETMSYFQAPPEVFEDSDAMKQWVGGSVSAGLRADRSRQPRARKRSGR